MQRATDPSEVPCWTQLFPGDTGYITLRGGSSAPTLRLQMCPVFPIEAEGDEVIETKSRVIQEYVPGKQVTIAHVIANPDEQLYVKVGLKPGVHGAIGILTITPSEAAIIAADVATKASDVSIGFVDRFSGSLLLIGSLADVESAVHTVVNTLRDTLGIAPADVTRS